MPNLPKIITDASEFQDLAKTLPKGRGFLAPEKIHFDLKDIFDAFPHFQKLFPNVQQLFFAPGLPCKYFGDHSYMSEDAMQFENFWMCVTDRDIEEGKNQMSLERPLFDDTANAVDNFYRVTGIPRQADTFSKEQLDVLAQYSNGLTTKAHDLCLVLSVLYHLNKYGHYTLDIATGNDLMIFRADVLQALVKVPSIYMMFLYKELPMRTPTTLLSPDPFAEYSILDVMNWNEVLEDKFAWKGEPA